jgi:hypothetical protein
LTRLRWLPPLPNWLPHRARDERFILHYQEALSREPCRLRLSYDGPRAEDRSTERPWFGGCWPRAEIRGGTRQGSAISQLTPPASIASSALKA